MPIEGMKSLLATIPALPGVYRFYDKTGKSLYIGKALNLKKRLYSYSLPQKQSPRIALMLELACSVETIVTESEQEALLLENNLIKSLKPRYNILFRDDKSYPFLCLSRHAYPRLMYYRGPVKNTADCFGPYPDAKAVKEAIDILQRIFRLRTCTDSAMANRQRPCLLHSIGRCSAPCVNHINSKQYSTDSEGARRFLRGESSFVEKLLTESMHESANEEKFEEASVFRDRLRALSVVRKQFFVNDEEMPNADYVGVYHNGSRACVNIAIVRGGYRIGERRIFPSNVNGSTAEETVSALLVQHYSDNIPDKLIVSPLPSDWQTAAPHLKKHIMSKITPTLKQRLQLVVNNAEQALLIQTAEQNQRQQRLSLLTEALSLAADPERMECFDISHSMGEETMASRVVFINGTPYSKEYRLYKIKTAQNDDGQSIFEAVSRCYARVQKEATAMPDLIFIDGGAIQLAAAQRAFATLSITSPPIFAIAKGADRKPGEEILIATDGEVIKIPHQSQALHLIQYIRDESHRFAIKAHRRNRDKKRSRYKYLEGIEGIGDKKRQKILAHFGGMASLRAASIRDLIKISSIGNDLAIRIYNALHP